MTANATVTPNCLKKRPMMPPMKPIGMNTATIVNVVAATARPISFVPSNAASRWCLPIAWWRTMFSRTTIASSISRPTQIDSASSVTRLIEKPIANITRNVPISEIGSVSPVITVERHDDRNRNTMTTVSSAPSTMLRWTLATELRIAVDASRTTDTVTSGGNSPASPATVRRTLSTTAIVFSPCARTTSSATARLPSTSALVSGSSSPSITSATCDRKTGWPPRRATMIRPKSATLAIFARICTTCSRSRETSVPAGSSWFSLASACITWSTPTFSASRSAGRSAICTSRRTPPTSVTRPTPRTFSRRRLTTWSASVVSSRASRLGERIASEITGTSSGL